MAIRPVAARAANTSPSASATTTSIDTFDEVSGPFTRTTVAAILPDPDADPEVAAAGSAWAAGVETTRITSPGCSPTAGTRCAGTVTAVSTCPDPGILAVSATWPGASSSPAVRSVVATRPTTLV